MSISINTNSAATNASVNMNASNKMLQKSLARMSSGSKINSPADDAGGLAVSMKLTAALKRTDAVNTNLSNAASFLQTQDGAMKTAGAVLDRISELRTLYDDVTKNSSDKANYDVEFTALQEQLADLVSENFNSVPLFGGTTLSVPSTEDASQTIVINQADLSGQTTDIASASSLSDIGISTVTESIQGIADLRATNGAQMNRLEFSIELLTVNKTNLEAANSRIVDTDVASESTQFAKANILVQSGAAMLSQANSSSQIALRLLGQ